MADITQRAAEYSKQKELEEAAKPKSIFTHDQLYAALLWVDDAFDRAAMLYFPVFETAKQIKNNDDLRGDWLDLGVRKLEWISGSKNILDAFMDEKRITSETKGDLVEYFYDGIPIRVHVFEDDACLQNCDTVVYGVEDFKIPNPYERFEQLYG